MPTFILSLNWTDQGIRSVKDAPKRSKAAHQLAKKVGIEIKQIFLTSGDSDLVVMARTDARSVEGFAAAVARAKLYRAAGADAIFAEALESADEFRAFAQEVGGPLLANMTEFGRSPNLDVATLAGLGFNITLFPLTAFRVAHQAAFATLRELAESGHQRNVVPQMLTRADLYDLLGYTGYEARDRAYFGRPTSEDSR